MTNVFSRFRTRRPRTTGLALGSGGARGWAHIGVIDALAEAGVRIDLVAGTSIGALVGAAYASGRIASLDRVVRELDWRKAIALFDVGLPRSGLFDGRKVTDSIREHVDCADIRDMPIPFCAVSTDLVDGREVHIRSGDVIDAVRASISIPGMFTPVKRDGMLLVDGGLMNPVPAGVAREMGADYVIAVDLNYKAPGVRGVDKVAMAPSHDGGGRDRTDSVRVPRGLSAPIEAIRDRMGPLHLPGLEQARHWLSRESVPNILEVLMSSINVMEMQITEMQLASQPPDLLIRPDLHHIRLMEFDRGVEAIKEGRRAARAALASIDARMLA